MRLWSIHPEYLDAKGLVALWRETLLAKHVLAGKTKGYKNHPQLERFKELKAPLNAINLYLSEIHAESIKRGYVFDKSKIDWSFKPVKMTVSKGQRDYEVQHLLHKLKIRDPQRYRELRKKKIFKMHPVFRLVPGKIARWEVIS